MLTLNPSRPALNLTSLDLLNLLLAAGLGGATAVHPGADSLGNFKQLFIEKGKSVESDSSHEEKPEEHENEAVALFPQLPNITPPIAVTPPAQLMSKVIDEVEVAAARTDIVFAASNAYRPQPRPLPSNITPVEKNAPFAPKANGPQLFQTRVDPALAMNSLISAGTNTHSVTQGISTVPAPAEPVQASPAQHSTIEPVQPLQDSSALVAAQLAPIVDVKTCDELEPGQPGALSAEVKQVVPFVSSAEEAQSASVSAGAPLLRVDRLLKKLVSNERSSDLPVSTKRESVSPAVMTQPVHSSVEASGGNHATGLQAPDAASSEISVERPPAAFHSMRLTEHLAGSELRFKWHSDDSGGIELSTNLRQHDVQIAVKTERADTATAMRAELPVLDSRLNDRSMRLGDVSIVAQEHSASAGLEMSGHHRGQREWNGAADVRNEMQDRSSNSAELVTPSLIADGRVSVLV